MSVKTDRQSEPLTYFVGNANGRGLIRIETAHDAPVAGVQICSLTRDKESWAAFIVEACNGYAALLAENEQAGRQLDESSELLLQAENAIDKLRARAEAAEAARDASQAAAKLWNESLDKAWDDAHARNQAKLAARKETGK